MPKYKIRSIEIKTEYSDQTVVSNYRYVVIRGIELKIPDDATDQLQLQYTFSHVGINPPQGISGAYLVTRGDARRSVDIGYNRYPGPMCHIKNNWLIFNHPVKLD